ncbi:hypothetical protein BUE80_DR012676, partial [Diplocarpon rosae]
MEDNPVSVSVCPYRRQATHDPSAIQTEQYEVQTQKFEFYPPARFEVSQSVYGKPSTFTGTEKDLALLAACEKGGASEQPTVDDNNPTSTEPQGDSDGQDHMENGGSKTGDGGGGPSIEEEASISQPVTWAPVENDPEDVSSLPPSEPNPPSQDDTQEQTLDKEVSGSTEAQPPPSPSSVELADDTAPPAFE